MSADILIVDDEEDIRNLIRGILEDEGYQIRIAASSKQAYEAVSTKVPDAIILDIWLQGSADDGLKILQTVKKENPLLPIIMISGHGTIETAVSAIKMGAYDFIEKPFKSDRLLVMLGRALEAASLRKENETLKKRSENLTEEIVGSSQIITNLQQMLTRAAPTNSRILLTGEPGTGKNMAARYIHRNSKRANKPFLSLNCASFRPERLEIELFGSVDGVMGEPAKQGLLELVAGGTLFLDEIGDMPIEVQGKLIRVLQEDCFQKVGSNKSIEIDIRFIASSSSNLEDKIAQGRFRRDLFYRLNVVPIQMPSLRERISDIPLLVETLAESLAIQTGQKRRNFSKHAIIALQSYSWPGNIRQLRNVLEWVFIMSANSTEEEFVISHLPPDIYNQNNVVSLEADSEGFISLPLREAREHFERNYLQAQINRFGGNISKTAQFVGMERSALHRKLKSLDIFAEEKPSTTTEKDSKRKTA